MARVLDGPKRRACAPLCSRSVGTRLSQVIRRVNKQWPCFGVCNCLYSREYSAGARYQTFPEKNFYRSYIQGQMDGGTYAAVLRQAAARCVPPAPTKSSQQNGIKIRPRNIRIMTQPDNKPHWPAPCMKQVVRKAPKDKVTPQAVNCGSACTQDTGLRKYHSRWKLSSRSLRRSRSLSLAAWLI